MWCDGTLRSVALYSINPCHVVLCYALFCRVMCVVLHAWCDVMLLRYRCVTCFVMSNVMFSHLHLGYVKSVICYVAMLSHAIAIAIIVLYTELIKVSSWKQMSPETRPSCRSYTNFANPCLVFYFRCNSMSCMFRLLSLRYSKRRLTAYIVLPLESCSPHPSAAAPPPSVSPTFFCSPLVIVSDS